MPTGRWSFLSAAFATHTGWSIAEWIGRPFAELVYPDDLPQANDRYAAILSGEMSARNEMRIRTKAGGFVVGEFHSAPIIRRGRVVGEQGVARDITDRRRAEEAHGDAEERIRTRFEATDEALLLIDGAAFVDTNSKGLEMFGLRDRSEIIGHSPADFAPPHQPDGWDSREKALEYILAALQGCPQRFFWKFARKDGSTFDAEVVLHPLTLHGRAHVQATVRDITARRAAEQAMLAGEERFRLLVAQVPADVWASDTDLRLTAVSGSLILELERPDLRKPGTTLYELFATRDESHPAIAAHRRALSGVSAQYERTAGPLVIEGRVEPLRDGAGAVVGCVGVALDITERRNAQKAWRRLANVVDSSDDAIVTTARDGTIETWNPAAARLYGYAAREAIGRPITVIMLPERAAEFQRNVRLLEQGQPVGPYETERVHSKGRVVSVSVTLSALRDARGALVGFSEIVRDISERKRAEEALRASEEKLRLLLERLPIGVSLLGQDRKVIYTNTALQRILGMSADDLIRGPHQSRRVVRPDGTPMPPEEFASARAFRERRPIRNVETGTVTESGETIWTSMSAAPLPGPEQGVVVATVDISKRKRAEEALRASETRYRSLIEHSMDLVSIMGADGRFTYASPSVVRLLGYAPDELSGQVGFGYVHPDDVAKIRAAFGRALQGETAETREVFRFRHKDGSWRVFESVVTNLLSEPTVAGVVINSRDITERVKAEETLRREQYLVNTLLANVPDSIYFKDAESRFIRINHNLAKQFGLSDPAQAVGKTDFDFFGPDHAQAAQETERQVMSAGRPAVDIEELETWPDRPDTWVSSTKMPLRDAAGSIVGTFGISRDITERKQTEEALRRSEAEYRSLVEQAPLGIYRTTIDGHSLKVNQALVAMLGYDSADDLLRVNARDFYADPEERERAMGQLEHTGEARVETEWKRKDGRFVTVRLNMRLVYDAAGAAEYIEGLIEDVTEQRSLESQFRQAQRMEAVGRLAGGVAHDFNNVLTAITGYSELLLDELQPGDPKRRDVEEIKAAGQRAAALTRQLLAFSRKQVLQTRVLDVNDVVRGLEKMLQRLSGEDVKVELALVAALGAVRADPGQLEQVIVNLAVNSRDAMPGGGQLTIETANVELDEAYVE